MKVSLGVYPSMSIAEILPIADLAEAKEYYGLWLPDSPLLWRDPFIAFGAVSVQTSELAFGVVSTPAIRDVTVLAAAWRTLAEAGSRTVRLVLGQGDTAVATAGVRPADEAELVEAVNVIRQLASGIPTSLGRGGTSSIAYATGQPPCSVHMMAADSSSLYLAGRYADGVLLMCGADPSVLKKCLDRVWDGLSDSGRERGDLWVSVWTGCYISDSVPESAVKAVKANVGRVILRAVPGMDDPATAKVARLVATEYSPQAHGKPGASYGELVPGDMAMRFAIAGTGADLRERLVRLSHLDVNEVVLAIPTVEDLEPLTEVVERVGDVVGELLAKPQ